MTTFVDFQMNTLGFLNELASAHRNANADNWPALRDEVLSRNGMEELSFLEYAGDK